jgi:hypothetical protein
MSGSILRDMNIIRAGVMAFLLLIPLAAKDAVQRDMPIDEKFVQYIAGVELLDRSKSMSGIVLAGKYRELCSITGIAADSAVNRIMRFKSQPALWQKIQEKALELLQTLQ